MRKFSMLAFAIGTVVSANAAVIMDHIGANPADMTATARASQDFEAAYNAYDIGMIDDFQVSGPTTLNNVEAFLGLWNNANLSFGFITNFRVEIYTSVGNAAGNLTGNAGTQTVGAGSATINTAYTSIANTALVSIPVNITLGTGSYFIAVISEMDFATHGQVGVADSNFAGSTPGGMNSYQVNPGGAFGLTGGWALRSTNSAYRIMGDPVPEPTSLVALGLGGLVLLRRRRK